MPRVKMPRKDTFVDMTAMCDVAFLLLTFFMLATSFKPDEPVTVRPPSSVSTDQIPEGFILITLDKDGRVFFSVDNLNAKRAIIEAVNEEKSLGLTSQQIENYMLGASVGVPFNMLSSYLSADVHDQTDLNKQAPGIPTDTTDNYLTNELAYWIKTARYRMEDARIAIKVDGEAAYPYVGKIITTLGKMKIFRFNFITDMKGVPSGTALYEERNNPSAPKPAPVAE